MKPESRERQKLMREARKEFRVRGMNVKELERTARVAVDSALRESPYEDRILASSDCEE